MAFGTRDILINPALTAGYVVHVTFVEALRLTIMVAHPTLITIFPREAANTILWQEHAPFPL
jgi:hypothetical protein